MLDIHTTEGVVRFLADSHNILMLSGNEREDVHFIDRMFDTFQLKLVRDFADNIVTEEVSLEHALKKVYRKGDTRYAGHINIIGINSKEGWYCFFNLASNFFLIEIRPDLIKSSQKRRP